MKKMLWVLSGVVVFVLFQNCSQVFKQEPAFEFSSVEVPLCYSWEASDLLAPHEVWRGAHEQFNQNMASPSVGDLDGDGYSEIVAQSFQGAAYSDIGAISIFAGESGKLKKSRTVFSAAFADQGSQDELFPYGASQPLLVDLNRDGRGEIVFVALRKAKGNIGSPVGVYLVATDFSLNIRWKKSVDGVDRLGPATGDINQSGVSNVIYKNLVLKEVKKSNGGYEAEVVVDLKTSQNGMNNISSSFAYTLTNKVGDFQDIVTGQGVFSRDGKMKFQYCRDGRIETLGSLKGYCKDSNQFIMGFPAVADLIAENPGAEIILSGNGYFHIFSGSTGELLGPQPQFRNLVEHDHTTKCSRIDGSGKPYSYVGGGQATIGDFNGLGEPQVAIATGRSLTIFNSKGEVIAGSTTSDCSSVSTGISSFDFNGDGRPEIVYGDEQYLRIYELKGSQLNTVWMTPNPSGTLLEYPIVADVDGDRFAELVVVANNYACPRLLDSKGLYSGAGGVCASMAGGDQLKAASITGVRVFKADRSTNWMPTRSIWNQGSYFPSNVGYDKQGAFSSNLIPSGSNNYNDDLKRIFKRNIQGNRELSCKK